MKKTIKFFFLLVIISIFNISSYANDKILFIDIDFIYSNSIVGKKIDKKLGIESEKINKEILQFKSKLKEQENELINQKNVISEDEFIKKKNQLEKNIKEYNLLISKKNNDFTKYKNETKNIFLNELVKIVQKYAEDNSIQLIIKKENIIIGKNNLDSTNEILKLLDEKIKDIKIK